MKRLFTSFYCFLSIAAIGQTSIFQDAKGESGFKFFGSAITINAKAESINAALDCFRRNPSTNKFDRWGVNLEVASNEGLANIKSEKGLLFDGSVGIYRGWKESAPAAGTGAGWTYERFISVNTGLDQNKFFNAGLPKKDMLFNKSDFTWKVELGQFGYFGNLLYGFSGSFKSQSNIGDLQPKSIRLLEYQLYNDSTLIYSDKKAYDETKFTGNQHVFSINADGALLLNQQVISLPGSTVPPMYAAVHLRYQKIEDIDGQFNPGVGFYIGRPKNPRVIIGGFNIQFLDLFNTEDKQTNAWKRASINIVAGFKLGN